MNFVEFLYHNFNVLFLTHEQLHVHIYFFLYICCTIFSVKSSVVQRKRLIFMFVIQN